LFAPLLIAWVDRVQFMRVKFVGDVHLVQAIDMALVVVWQFTGTGK
jgi:hypothetical protein